MSSDQLAKAGGGAAAVRRPIPPFTEEHEEFRAAVRRFMLAELAPAGAGVGGRALVPQRGVHRAGRARVPGTEVRGARTAGRAAATSPRPCSPKSSRTAARAASPPASAPTSTSRCRRSGSSGPRTRSSATSSPASAARRSARSGSPSPTRAPTSPGSRRSPSGSTAATSSTARRCSSPTGCGPTSSSPPSRRQQEGGHHGLSFLIVDRGEGVDVSSAIEKLGWHASDTALITFDDVFVPEENLLGEENQGFYLIMANFQWERLLMALGSVGGDAALLRPHARVRARSARPSARPIGSHQAIRHKFAEMATTIEAGPRPDLPRAAPVRRRPRRGTRGDDGQARHASAPPSTSPTPACRSTAAPAT